MKQSAQDSKQLTNDVQHEKSSTTSISAQPISLGEKSERTVDSVRTTTELRQDNSHGNANERDEDVISRPTGVPEAEEGCDDWGDVGSELFKDVACAIDKWEKEMENFHESKIGVKTTHAPGMLLKPPVVQDPLHSRNASGVPPVQQVSTPTRSQFVNHVMPVTLLPPAMSRLGPLPVKGFYGADKESPVVENSKASKLSSASCAEVFACCKPEEVVRIQGGSPPLFFSEAKQLIVTSSEGELREKAHLECHKALPYSVAVSDLPSRHSPNIVEETPPFKQDNGVSRTHTTESSYTRPKSKFHSTASSSVGDKFKTPDPAKWMQFKQHNSNFSPSNENNITPFSSNSSSVLVTKGGKITPPLCGCGRRAKRKVVCSPGPNEGKPFYVCPNSRGNDRKRGCHYFKWELHMSDCLSAAKPLLSDYGE